jgi:hypothetical protein
VASAAPLPYPEDEHEGGVPAAPSAMFSGAQLPLWTELCQCSCGCRRLRHPANLYCNRCFLAHVRGRPCENDRVPEMWVRRPHRKGRP